MVLWSGERPRVHFFSIKMQKEATGKKKKKTGGGGEKEADKVRCRRGMRKDGLGGGGVGETEEEVEDKGEEEDM